MKLEEGYNVHGYIAQPLESYARKEFKIGERPNGKIFDADYIESETFAEVIGIILRKKSEYIYDGEINEFIAKVNKYKLQSLNSIDIFEVKSIFEEFKKIYENI